MKRLVLVAILAILLAHGLLTISIESLEISHSTKILLTAVKMGTVALAALALHDMKNRFKGKNCL